MDASDFEPMDEVVIATYDNQAEAAMWAEVLSGAGIACRIARVSLELAAVGFDAWAPHELRVFAKDLPEANQLLGLDLDESALGER